MAEPISFRGIETFNHKPLCISKRTIRLFRLVYPSARVDLELFEFDLDSLLPHYRALSYTWGAETDTRFIYINEQAFSARQNLYRFLRLYKERAVDGDYGWLWVDQVHERIMFLINSLVLS
jgi:hypothetical protein